MKHKKVESKNIELLQDFAEYCVNHPDERFWQALRNWSGYSYVGVKEIVADGKEWHDTFYFERKNQ